MEHNNELAANGKAPINLNDYIPMVEFIKYNKEHILKNAKNDPCLNNGIMAEMQRYFILPLIRDGFCWVFEFIRNLMHFGYKEFLYVSSFYIYIVIYDTYSAYFNSVGTRYPFICDCFIYFPFIIAQIVGTTRMNRSWAAPITYFILSYCIVLIPRVVIQSIHYIKNILASFKKIEGFGNEKLEYMVAGLVGVLYGGFLAMVFYGTRIKLLKWIVGLDNISPLYMRECLSGLIVFSVVRGFFLYSECLISNGAMKDKNILLSANRVTDLKTSLFMIMIYGMFIIGSVSFVCTYYSITQAMKDTTIVEDIECINSVASKVCSDPLGIVINIAKGSLTSLFTGMADSIKGFYDGLIKNPKRTLEKVGMFIVERSPLYWILKSIDIKSLF